MGFQSETKTNIHEENNAALQHGNIRLLDYDTGRITNMLCNGPH